jgi:signal transduction histidine kinase
VTNASAAMPASMTEPAESSDRRAPRAGVAARIGSTTATVAVAAGVVAVLLAVFAYVIASSQSTSRGQARERFEAQATIAAALTESIISSAAAPEARAASASYASATIDPRLLTTAARRSGLAFEAVAAHDGRLIASSRITPALRAAAAGLTAVAARTAASGRPWLSDLIPDGGNSYLIDTAVPFATPFGTRILLGASPATALTGFLTGYLVGGLPDKSEHGFVIDGSGRIVASSVATATLGQDVRNKPFVNALASRRGGYDAQTGSRYLVAAPIAGSSWRVAITEPTATLYPAAVGSQLWVMWTVFGAFALAALAGLILFRRTLIGADRMVEQAKLVDAANQALTAANAELDSFSYSVSHDLRAPLRAIDGFSKIVLEDDSGQLTDAQRRYLGLVRHSTQTMGVLIDDLLGFSRLSNRPLERRSVDSAALVRHVEDELVVGLDAGEIEFRNGDLPAVEADPVLLGQVWTNLIENAIKYSRDRHPALVSVGSEQHDGELVFFVRDNGVGFDMRHAGKLFQVFHRLHRVDEYPGTGVGLAIVQRIVMRHGGRVWAEAEPGAGATFYFTLSETQP